MNHTIQNSYLTVTAAEKGAELQSILSAGGTEYLWQGDSRYWSDRALNLFPYVARLTEGCYYLDGKRYEMDIHGLAPYRDFSLVSNHGEEMILELASSEETMRHYPRQFAFRVIYRLVENVLEVTFEVENRDEKTMYFGLGGHPGFRVPLGDGAFEDYRLRFDPPCQPKRICFSPDCFVTGDLLPFSLEDGILPLRHELFHDDAIVLTDMSRRVVLESNRDGRSVAVDFPQMPYLGLWHWPRTDAPYVCIEPWCSLPAREDTITVMEEQEDLIALEAGETYRNLWTIRITEA